MNQKVSLFKHGLNVPLNSMSCKAFRKIPGTMLAILAISNVTFMNKGCTEVGVSVSSVLERLKSSGVQFLLLLLLR